MQGTPSSSSTLHTGCFLIYLDQRFSNCEPPPPWGRGTVGPLGQRELFVSGTYLFGRNMDEDKIYILVGTLLC
jgi:hypothetical protein